MVRTSAVAVVLALAAAPAGEESPWIVKTTAGCTVKLSGAVTAEQACAATASRSGDRVILTIVGPTPWDPTKPEDHRARPLVTNVVVSVTRPAKRTYEGGKDGAVVAVNVGQKVPRLAWIADPKSRSSLTLTAVEEKGKAITLHGTITAELTRSPKGGPADIEVTF